MTRPAQVIRQFGLRELVIAAALSFAAVGIAMYKVYWLGYRIVEIRPEPGYAVSLTIDLEVTGKDVKVSTFLPLQTSRQRIRRENESSESFEFSVDPSRKATWKGQDLDGKYQINYSFFAQTESMSHTLPDGPLITPPPNPQLVAYLNPTPRIQCEDEDIMAKAWQLMPLSVDTITALQQVFKYVHEEIEYRTVRGPTDASTAFKLGEASCNGKNRLLIALLRARGIPARFAKGLILENINKRTTHAWSEVWIDGQWIPFCPTNGYFAEIPRHYLELAKEDRALFVRTASIGFDWEFVVTPQVQRIDEAVQANASNPLNFLNYWVSQHDSHVSIHLIMIVLLIPIAASVVSIARSVVGLHTFGTFMPSLIAVSFLDTGYLTGSLVFIVIMLLTGVLNLFILKLRILHLPRLVIILTVVVMTIMAVSVLTTWLGLPGAAGISLFPIAILSLTSERFSQTILEDGWKEAINRTVVSYIVSAVCYLVIAQQDLQVLVAAFPELLLLNIALNMALGSWHGLRLAEYLRFSTLLKKADS